MTHEAIEVPAEKSTGLDFVVVVYDASEMTEIEISGISGTEIDVTKYSNLGGGYAVETPFTRDGDKLRITSPEGDMGYMIKDGGNSFNFWIVNYLPVRYNVSSISAPDVQECENTTLNVSGSGVPIRYFTIDGRMKTLSRDIELSYTTLEWNEEQSVYLSIEKEQLLESVTDKITVIPPFYCNTTAVLSGDRFLKEWGMADVVETPLVHANGVASVTKAEQTNSADDNDDASNMIGSESTSGLGGSAPADITFYSYVTDAVIHYEWQMASDANFDNILFRFNEQDLSYTFNEEGQFYVRFIGSNSDGSCETIGDSYAISIGASELRIPNAFSPDDDGVNDVWKVGYRSLLEFKCWIFDRNGNQLHYFDRPDQGWDGKYKGKTVSPGVYYYVIDAVGADGKKYKKGGDINIIRYKRLGNSTASPTE